MLHSDNELKARQTIIQQGQEQTIKPIEYKPLAHTVATHAINRIGKRSKLSIEEANALAKISGCAEWAITTTDKKTLNSVKLANQEQVKAIFLKPSTEKVYNYIIMKFTPNIPDPNREYKGTLKELQDLWPVSFNISEFMTDCKLKDKKHARELLYEAGLALRELSWRLNIYDQRNKKYKLINILFANKVLTPDEPTLTNATFTFSLDNSFVQYLSEYGKIMAFDPRYYKIDTQKYPNALNLAIEILYLANQRANDKGEAIIKANTLLKACGGLMQIEDIQKTKQADRHFTQRILDPIENSLDHITDIGILKGWEYCSKGGKDIDPDNISIKNIDNLYIKIALPMEYPIQQQQQARRTIAKNKAKAKKRAKNRSVKNG